MPRPAKVQETKPVSSPKEPTAPQEAPKPAPVAPTVTNNAPAAAAPQLRENPAPYADGSMVVLVGPDGSRTSMTRTAAEKFKRHGRNANYQIEG